ncbi:transcription factor [Spathaspora passalidarum NRRL Y-27907]|uniref:Transcription factor n=1 Tax=Spathaspora passalidarum (strain NRRL Y-27907 / 11-Y1) TaxID=619300 RepID=G3AN32_SPAPN|nr:transcription factor [Spathaspora passalidarum NRRL Y-27907]EGW32446.1 transcription factor [Spathaspora passalidarum NRRL Y-27907]
MDSPIHIGDLTTNSIQHKLDGTHLSTTIRSYTSTLHSTVYSSIKLIQLTLNLSVDHDVELIVLRRVQDSFVNVSQLLDILIQLRYFSSEQLKNFLSNEVLDNIEYYGTSDSPQYLDWRDNDEAALRGVWVPYDKAVSLALKFDIYELVKKLFLVDVHEFENLPKANKRVLDEVNGVGSPVKKQKVVKEEVRYDLNNPNYPMTLPPKETSGEIINELKVKLGEIFKRDDQQELTVQDVKNTLEPILSKSSPDEISDVQLDPKGQTSLHFAATLASVNLVTAFIELGINSPIRGNSLGESPLISTIQVTNSMEKGNFSELLTKLYPDIWLFDNNKCSVLHHLTAQLDKKAESSKFYTKKIIEYLIHNDKHLFDFRKNIVNAQDVEGNTALHVAVEKENKWFIKLLLELGADITLANKLGVSPSDFEIVKELVKDSEDVEDGQVFELIRTAIEFLNKRLEINSSLPELEQPTTTTTTTIKEEPGNSSAKIFQSIQQLLSNTNTEYETILNSKREQIKTLDKVLHDATIITANNKFITKKIKSKLVQLDNLKLQIANITDKLAVAKQELPEDNEDHEYNAEEPFIIKPLYDRLLNNEPVDDLRDNPELLSQLETPILKARVNAYKQVNEKLEQELAALVDYNELTSKFKKVVSICTGVDINEVDELLDGLLEAVEGQQ